MTAPFVVFSLPRSRSTWLSVFLSHGGRVIGHDIGIECGTPEEFAKTLRRRAGTCETGAAFAWRKIRQLIPDVRFVVVSRDVGEVIKSLRGLGLYGLDDEICSRNQHMNEISALPDTLTVEYIGLDWFFECDRIHRFCLDRPADPDWFDKMTTTNVQVDLRWQMGRLLENRDRITELKRLATA